MRSDSQTDQSPNEVLFARFEQLISSVLDAKVTAKVDIERTLWETKDVATYLRLSYRYTSEYIVTHHTFPNALRLPTRSNTRGHPRWYAGEVMSWAANFQEH